MLGFPLPYHDELLYSTIARHGIHSGVVSPKELLNDVYGDTKVIATSDLPGNLQSVAAHYPAAVKILPIDLLYRHSLFPLYAPFMGELRRKRLIGQLTEDSRSTVHVTAGVAASRVKQPGFLRYCPECLRIQLNQYGEYYWQRSWQVAGADCCPAHGALRSSFIHRHDVHRHHYRAANAQVCPQVVQQPCSRQGKLISESVRELLSLSAFPAPDYDQWSVWYWQLAYKHQLVRGQQVKHDLVSEKVKRCWGAQWLEAQGLLPVHSESCWLKAMFRKHRKAFSYLEHFIVLHAFLEPDWHLNDVMEQVSSLTPYSRSTGPNEPFAMDFNEVELNSYRSRWMAAVSKHGAKYARANGSGDAYAWLYRHDRDWLKKTNAVHRAELKPRKPRVDWHRRDLESVRVLIRLRAETEQNLMTPRWSMNWYLAQLEHKATVEKHLEQLPLCRLFLKRYCENIEQYQIRRITRTVIQLLQTSGTPKRWQLLRGAGLSEYRLTSLARAFLKEVIGV